MENMKSGSIHFKDSVEAAAYAVCLEGLEKEPQYHIDSTNDGFELILEKPISMITHLGIMGAIASDQKINPAKWEKTRTEIKGKQHEKN